MVASASEGVCYSNQQLNKISTLAFWQQVLNGQKTLIFSSIK